MQAFKIVVECWGTLLFADSVGRCVTCNKSLKLIKTFSGTAGSGIRLHLELLVISLPLLSQVSLKMSVSIGPENGLNTTTHKFLFLDYLILYISEHLSNTLFDLVVKRADLSLNGNITRVTSLLIIQCNFSDCNCVVND